MKYKTVLFIQCFAVLLISPPALADAASDAEAYFDQADKENADGSYSDAENHYRQGVKTAVSGMGAMSSLAGKLSRQLGDFYVKRGRYADAEHYYMRAIVVCSGYSEALADGEGDFRNVRGFLTDAIQNPAHLPASIEVANTLSSLAELYRKTGRLDDSERLLRQVVKIFDGANSGSSPYYTADAKNAFEQSELSLAQVLAKQGKTLEAENTFKAYVEHSRKRYGNSPKLAEALNQLEAFYKSQDRSSDAESAAAESKEIMSQFR